MKVRKNHGTSPWIESAMIKVAEVLKPANVFQKRVNKINDAEEKAVLGNRGPKTGKKRY